MTQDIRKFAFIDALRGYAILSVLAVHSAQSVRPTGSILEGLMSQGARGVQLFFIASALTLTLSWNSRRAREASPTRNFYLRRLLRIAPMFYVGILFYVVLYGFAPRYWAPNGIAWWFIPLTALFLNGYLPQTVTSVVPGGWSIAAEMNFYLVLPLILRHVAGWKSRAAFIVLSLALYAASRVALTRAFGPFFAADQQYLVSSFTFLNFFGQLPIFAMGLFLAALFERPAALRRFVGWGAAGFIAIVILNRGLGLPGRDIDNYLFVGFGLTLFAGFLACHPNRVLANPAIAWIGKISFSMYLLHFAVLEALARSGFTAMFPPGDGSSLLFFTCLVAVTAPLSYLTYLAVETPGIRLGGKLIDYLEGRESADAREASKARAPG